MNDPGWQVEELLVLQTDLDDESPEVIGALIPRLLAAGALDAHLVALQMKKGRPGTRLEVLCRPALRDDLLRMLFRETSTLGVKVRTVERHSLDRRMEKIDIGGHPVNVKLALLDDEVLRAVPEMEDCRAVAEKTGRPLRDVLDEARAGARRFLG